MAKLGVRVNLLSTGLSQVRGWNFNSIAELGEFLLAGDDSGVKTLDGETDGGTNIDAVFETPMHRLGVQHPKRVRALYMTYSAGDALTLVSTTNEDSTGFTSTIGATSNEVEQSTVIPGRRDVRGVNWQFKISNTNGADFSLDYLGALFVPLTRGRNLT